MVTVCVGIYFWAIITINGQIIYAIFVIIVVAVFFFTIVKTIITWSFSCIMWNRTIITFCYIFDGYFTILWYIWYFIIITITRFWGTYTTIIISTITIVIICISSWTSGTAIACRLILRISWCTCFRFTIFTFKCTWICSCSYYFPARWYSYLATRVCCNTCCRRYCFSIYFNIWTIAWATFVMAVVFKFITFICWVLV